MKTRAGSFVLGLAASIGLGLCLLPGQPSPGQTPSPSPRPAAPPEASATPKILLRENWAIQSSADVRAAGAAVSAPGFQTRDWYRATVPSTVLGALVQQRVYPDPYVGMNLRSIAGTSYPIFSNFSNDPMPPDSPFRHRSEEHTSELQSLRHLVCCLLL